VVRNQPEQVVKRLYHFLSWESQINPKVFGSWEIIYTFVVPRRKTCRKKLPRAIQISWIDHMTWMPGILIRLAPGIWSSGIPMGIVLFQEFIYQG
jgi:hypothetical protein